MPTSIEYNMSAVSNPDGYPGPGLSNNFLTDDSKIDIDFDFILPLWFSADNFAFVDTLKDIFGADWHEKADIIDRITVMLEIANGLPLDIDFQVTFMDSLYNPVDTLFAEDSQPIISVGILDGNDRVETPGIKTSIIQYTNAEILQMKDARHVILRAGLKTPTVNDEVIPVKFYTDYSVDFNLSIGVDIKGDPFDN